MPKKIPDLVVQRLKKSLKAQPGQDKAALAAEHGVSLSTVKRLAAEVRAAEPSAAVRRAKARAAAKDAIASLDSEAAIKGQDFRAILLQLLDDLAENLPESRVGSKEGGTRAAIDVMRVYREFFPPTMDEAIDHLMTLPDFEPLEFARRLRARYEQAL